MSDSTFSKVEAGSDTPMYGPRALIVIGYAPLEREAFKALLRILGLTIPAICAGPELLDQTLGHVATLDPDHTPTDGPMPRAIIMSGLTEAELHTVMRGWDSLKLPAQLWAAMTPTSENWPLTNLLDELAREHAAMQARRTCLA